MNRKSHGSGAGFAGIFLALVLCAWVAASPAEGADPGPPPGPPPQVLTSGRPAAATHAFGTNGTIQLGQVTIDRVLRLIRFPAVVNQRAGTVEYAVVTSRGKTHESVFRTDAEPLHIHLALLLLDATPAPTNLVRVLRGETISGDRVWLDFSWQATTGEVRRPLAEAIRLTNSLAALDPTPWIHNGSLLRSGILEAQREGSLVAVYDDSLALINHSGPLHDDDDAHLVNADALPPDDRPVTIRIALKPLPTAPVATDTNLATAPFQPARSPTNPGNLPRF